MREVISVNDVSYSYDNKVVLEDVNLEIEQGDFAALIGPNGSGKSTFIKLALGILPLKKGQIYLLGTRIKKFNDWRKIGYIPQDVREFNHSFPATVKEVIAANLYKDMGLLKVLTSKLERRVDNALQKVGMIDYKDSLIGQLSGGQQQRVFIARTLVTEPEVIFLDEPLAGVDASSESSFYNLLSELNDQFNITIIMISHSVNIVSTKANKVVCFADRKIHSHHASNFNYDKYIKELKEDKAIVLPHRHDKVVNKK